MCITIWKKKSVASFVTLHEQTFINRKTARTLHTQRWIANLFTWCANKKESFHSDTDKGLGPISVTVSNIFALKENFLNYEQAIIILQRPSI